MTVQDKLNNPQLRQDDSFLLDVVIAAEATIGMIENVLATCSNPYVRIQLNAIIDHFESSLSCY